MEQQVIITEAKRSLYHRLPKWVQFLLKVLSIITVVYWLGYLIYKILCAIRCIGAFIFDTRNYWTFLCCILILLIGTLIAAQCYLGLDPIGQVGNWFIDRWNDFKNLLIEALM